MNDPRFPEGTLRPDLAAAFRGLDDAEESMLCLYEDDRVTWDAPFVARIAERIIELSAIVVQNALVATERVEVEQEIMATEWTPPPQPELSGDRKAQLAEARQRATKQEGSLL